MKSARGALKRDFRRAADIIRNEFLGRLYTVFIGTWRSKLVGVRIQCLYCRQEAALRIVEGAVRTGRLNPDPCHSSPLWVDKLVAEENVAEETWLGFGLEIKI